MFCVSVCMRDFFSSGNGNDEDDADDGDDDDDVQEKSIRVRRGIERTFFGKKAPCPEYAGRSPRCANDAGERPMSSLYYCCCCCRQRLVELLLLMMV